MYQAKKQDGFSAIEIVLTMVLLSAIGLVAYYAYQARQTAGHPKTTQSTVQPTAPSAANSAGEDMANWKSYTTRIEKASFKYPADWTLEEKSGDDSIYNKIVYIKSPGGLRLQLIENIDGLGGGCDHPEKHVMFPSVRLVSTVNGKTPVYLVENESIIALAQKETWMDGAHAPFDSGACLYYPLLKSKGTNENELQFGSTIQVRPSDEPFSAAQKADLPVARKILQSFHY